MLVRELLESSHRKSALENIADKGKRAIEHIVKVLKWKDEDSKSKHVHDINNWLSQTQEKKLYNKKLPDSETYHTLLFKHHDVDSDVAKNMKHYSKCKDLRSNEEIHHIIQNHIAHKVSDDLSSGKKVDISKHLPRDDE